MKQLTSISKSQIISKGVQSLADRPNANAQYGAGGLSSTQLKLWFDKLATFLAEKINELQTTLASDEAADYIRIPLERLGVASLKDIVDSFASGAFADKLLQVYASATAEERCSLQSFINNITKELSLLKENARKKEDTSNRYEKTVPAGVGKYALVKSIGGATKASKNKINPASVSFGYNFGGAIPVTPPAPCEMTVNDDGSLTVRTHGSRATTSIYNSQLSAGKYYYHIECDNEVTIVNHGGYISITLEASSSYGGTFNIKMMLWKYGESDTVEITTAPNDTEFEPYFEEVKNVAITRIESIGADGETVLGILNIPEEVQIFDGYGREGTYIEWNDDGTITFTVTKDANLNDLSFPNVVDVTNYFVDSNVIAVQQGGIIRSANADKLAAPTNIVYSLNDIDWLILTEKEKQHVAVLKTYFDALEKLVLEKIGAVENALPTYTEGLSYTLSQDGTYYFVSGIGTATDTDIIIPSIYEGLPVKRIAVNAFKDNTNITSVNIPDSIVAIIDSAFSGCTKLKNVTIGNGVTSIGNYTFDGCSGLSEITLGKSLTSFGYHAFKNCIALTRINFNATAMNDLHGGMPPFINAGIEGEGIKVIIGKTVTKIPDRLFFADSSTPKIVSVEFEEGSVCESIGARAFYNCTSLISISIPKSITSIGDQAFSDCTSLTIYCETESKPTDWHYRWNESNCPVVWGASFDFPSVNEKLANKLDKTEEANKLYGTDGKGEQTNYTVNSNIIADAIPCRTWDGNLYVPEKPSNTSYSATSKKYVDDADNALSEKQNLLEERVSDLESLTLTYTEDKTTAYEKSVPAEVGKYALVKSIGGATEKALLTRNLFNPRNISIDNGEYGGELEVKYLANDYVEVSVINDYLYFKIAFESLGSVGRYYWYAQGLSNDDTITEETDADGNVRYMYIRLYDRDWEYIPDINRTFRLMVYKDESVTTERYELYPASEGTVFEPYTLGFRHAEVTAVVSEKKNENVLNPASFTCYAVGGIDQPIDFTIETDGSLTIPLTSQQGFKVMLAIDSEMSKNAKYYVFVESNAGYHDITYELRDDLDATSEHLYISLEMPAGEQYENYYPDEYTFNAKIMVWKYEDSDTFGFELAPEGTVFKPYKGELIDSITIPVEAIKARVDGFGLDKNYIQWTDKKVEFVQRKKSVILNSKSGAWQSYVNQTSNGAYVYYMHISDKKVGLETSDCCPFENKSSSWLDGFAGQYSDHPTLTSVYFCTDIATLAEWKAWLDAKEASGNPVELEYELATPVITDITDLFAEDNSIEVEGGGDIVPVNEHEMAVPSNIVYVTRKG